MAPYRCRSCSVDIELLPRNARGRRPEYCSKTCKADAAKSRAAKLARSKPAPKCGEPPRAGKRSELVAFDLLETYTPEQCEYLRAVDAYRKGKRRPFPTATEYLEIAKSLGYRKCESGRAAA